METPYALDRIVLAVHTERVKWDVDLHGDFFVEFGRLPQDVQDELLARSAPRGFTCASTLTARQFELERFLD